jgi:hypothetical protein
MAVFLCKSCYAWIFWEINISAILRPKIVKLYRQAGLTNILVWTQLQIKIQSFGFTGKVE